MGGGHRVHLLKCFNPAKTLETTNNALLCQAAPSTKYFNLHLSPPNPIFKSNKIKEKTSR